MNEGGSSSYINICFFNVQVTFHYVYLLSSFDYLITFDCVYLLYNFFFKMMGLVRFFTSWISRSRTGKAGPSLKSIL